MPKRLKLAGLNLKRSWRTGLCLKFAMVNALPDFAWIPTGAEHLPMPKSTSLRHLIRRLRELGFDGPYSGGRHLFMCKGELKVRVPNPHAGNISAALEFAFAHKKMP